MLGSFFADVRERVESASRRIDYRGTSANARSNREDERNRERCWLCAPV